MENLIEKAEQHWRMIAFVVTSILWVGRLTWRVGILEKKPPAVTVIRCDELREACSEKFCLRLEAGSAEFVGLAKAIEKAEDTHKERYDELHVQFNQIIQHLLDMKK